VQNRKRVRRRLHGLAALCLLFGACARDPQDAIGRIYAWKAQPTDRNVAKIRSYLADPDRDVRATSLHALVSLAVQDAAAISLSALGDGDGFVRATAARCLGELREASAAAPLGERLASDPDWHVRRLAAEALAAIGGAEAVAALVLALEDPVRSVRLAAVAGAGELDPEAAFDVLARIVLDDPDWEVRVQAARAIGRSKRPEALPTLEAAQKDPNEFVRAAASAALAGLPPPSSPVQE